MASNSILNGTPNLSVRSAKQQDMKAVFQMIKELAEWEKMSHKLRLDEEQLTKDFINKAFHSLVVEAEDRSLVGYAIYNIDYSTWEGKSLILVDLFIKEKYRGKKIGEQLFISVMKAGDAQGCQKAYFHVLSWNPAIKFYKRLGCTDGSPYLVYRLEHDNFKKLVNTSKL
ncbi:thialysine N-epsilon-acetyltransferase-like [Diorhabda carinulata]|nr:thialysine N-epsilon-acetyltransferase-like [Diorhabda carinulata]